MFSPKLAHGAVLLLMLRTVIADTCSVEGYYNDETLVVGSETQLESTRACKQACKNFSGCLSYQFAEFEHGQFSQCNFFGVDNAHNDLTEKAGAGYFFYDITCLVSIDSL